MDSRGSKEWFKHWFDSPYYHILYQHRDEQEAEFFLDHLIARLRPSPVARMLDIPCGKGRHAIYLHKKGFDVTGVDLSKRNIEMAAQHSGERLRFYVHDMRHLLHTNYFDYVFNLFTSFGYFKRPHENRLALRNMAAALVRGGTLVLDFFNAELLLRTLPKEETKTIGELRFHINRAIEGNKVVKTIRFEDQGQKYDFREEVNLLRPADFERSFRDAGLVIESTFGSYDLQAFDATSSERLIYVAKKI